MTILKLDHRRGLIGCAFASRNCAGDVQTHIVAEKPTGLCTFHGQAYMRPDEDPTQAQRRVANARRMRTDNFSRANKKRQEKKVDADGREVEVVDLPT